MSKYELQEQALQASGVSVEESQKAVDLSPSIYERIGTEGFEELSTLFYNRVFEDDQPWFLNIFSSSTKSEAIENQVSSHLLVACSNFDVLPITHASPFGCSIGSLFRHSGVQICISKSS